MRRPILTAKTQTSRQVDLGPHIPSRTTVELKGLSLEKKLRQKRSTMYTEAMAKLDARGAICDHSVVTDLINKIRHELPELHFHQYPIGIIAKCYLGAPYEVHMLNVKLEIVQHFKKGEVLPEGMEKSRYLALHPGYEYIEVYTNYVCAVSKSGSVSMIREG